MTGLIAEMTRRGLKVAAVKRCHGDFSLDVEGKDSSAFTRAGASGVGLVSSEGWAFMGRSAEDPVLTAAGLFKRADVLLVEGGKHVPGLPKIEVLRRGISEERCVPEGELSALVADFEVEAPPGVPVFRPEDVAAVCDHILRSGKEEAMKEVTLEIDGKDIRLNPFVQRFIESTVLGMIGALDGVPAAPDTVIVKLKGGPGVEKGAGCCSGKKD